MKGTPVLLALLAVPSLALSGCVHDDNAWALQATGIAALRERGLAGQGVRVAILDTGIDLDAPSLRHLDDGDLFNGEVVGYRDFTGEAGGPKDRDGHGTFVAGVLAGAPTSGGLGRLRPGPVVPGGAPDVSLLVGRVSSGEDGSLRALALALEWALDESADIISLSLGVEPAVVQAQPDTASRFERQLARAERDGVLVVAAHGNAVPLFPADQPTVLGVGSMDRDQRPLQPRAAGKPDVYAPGRAITGPDADQGLVTMDGTSAAVPFVVAAAALVLSDSVDPYDAKSVARLRSAFSAASAGPDGAPGLVQADLALRSYKDPWR